MSTVSVDIRAYIAVITIAMAIAFGVGVAYGPVTAVSESTSESKASSRIQIPRRSRTKHVGLIGKKIPDLNEIHVNFEKPAIEDLGNDDRIFSQTTFNKSGEDETPTVERESTPSGQHLMVDISNVEAAFLNSERRLADAMMNTVTAAGYNMLSYHCHSLIPAGVSCVGVLRESHISFHTWPDEGVITLDMFTSGPRQLLPTLKDIEHLFGVPRKKDDSDSYEEVEMRWSHELRGFRTEEDGKLNHLHKSDLATWVMGPLFGRKKEVFSNRTKYQQVDIWDIWEVEATPTHFDATAAGLQKGDPRWKSDSDIISPRRHLYLNGVYQRDNHTAFEFIETLVQPAMFAHPSPKRAAIVGGGDGVTLREILKHNTIEKVILVESDESLIHIAREFLPTLSDCSNFVGLADNCFDDQRVEVAITDAGRWFKDKSQYNDDISDMFDIIILDAIDPKHESSLYNDRDLLDALYASLSTNGVMAVHIGSSHSIHDPKPDIGVTAPRERFMQLLENHPKTAAMMVYEESHNGYDEPHMFLVVCMDATCRSHWNADPAVVNDEIFDRIRETKNNDNGLVHFDGATQRSYQMPPKSWETVYCRRMPEPFECSYRELDASKGFYEIYLDKEGNVLPDSAFEVKIRDDTDDAGISSVFAREDIPPGSYIMPSDVAASFTMNEKMLDGIVNASQVKGTGPVIVIEDYLSYVEKHGHKSAIDGLDKIFIEVGGSTLIRKSPNVEEVNVGRWMPPHPNGRPPVHSPVYDRRLFSFEVFLVATRHIKAGEEIVRYLLQE